MELKGLLAFSFLCTLVATGTHKKTASGNAFQYNTDCDLIWYLNTFTNGCDDYTQIFITQNKTQTNCRLDESSPIIARTYFIIPTGIR